MNAASSVLGSVLAIVIAIQFGLNVTLACGAVAYVVAMLLLPTFGKAARQHSAISTSAGNWVPAKGSDRESSTGDCVETPTVSHANCNSLALTRIFSIAWLICSHF